MGQQQLLLLVLSTVIVGLATVAGIQAFDEGRSQAAGDALSQKAAEVAADIKGVSEKPEQLGGLDLSPSDVDTSEVNSRLGIQDSVSVPTANGGCWVSDAGNGSAAVRCRGGGDYSDLEFWGVYEEDGEPEVSVQTSEPTSD